MKFTMVKQVGDAVFEFVGDSSEFEDEMDWHKRMSYYSSLPEVCENCESSNIVLRYSQTKEGYEYAKVECRDCSCQLDFGRRKIDGGLFPKEWGFFEQKVQNVYGGKLSPMSEIGELVKLANEKKAKYRKAARKRNE